MSPGCNCHTGDASGLRATILVMKFLITISNVTQQLMTFFVLNVMHLQGVTCRTNGAWEWASFCADLFLVCDFVAFLCIFSCQFLLLYNSFLVSMIHFHDFISDRIMTFPI